MALGDIGSIHDTLVFSTTRGGKPTVCHIFGNVYAVAYWGPESDCTLATFSINSAGDISNTVLDSWAFDDQNALEPFIVLPYPNRVAIAYRCNTPERLIVTIAVADDGTISKSIIDHVTFAPAWGLSPSIILAHEGILAAFRNRDDNDGPVSTVTVNQVGELGNSFLDALSFPVTAISRNRIFHVYGNIFGVVFRDTSGYGQVSTFEIDPTGAISNVPISTLAFDGVEAHDAWCVKAVGNYFAIVYRGPDEDGFLKIVEIDHSGAITDPVVDIYEFDPAIGYPGNILSLGLGYIAVVYRGDLTYGILKTFLVDSSGHLNSTTLDTFNFDVDRGYEPFLFHVSGNMYGIAYEGVDVDGFLISVDIETPTLARPHHEMIMKIGP